MNEFLNSVKDDLLDARLRLVVLVLGAALIAAVAFVVLGGSSSTTTAPASTGPVTAEVAGIAIRQAPSNAAEPVAETTNGAAHQLGGPTRNPFAPLPGSTVTATTATTTSAPASPAGAQRLLVRLGLILGLLHLRRHDSRRHAQTQRAEEVEGLRPLPRDREVRRPAGADQRSHAGARSAAENLRGHADRRTAPEQEQHAAGVHGRAAAHGQGSRVRAHRRGDPARERHLRAERHAVPGDPPGARGRARRSNPSNPTAARSPTN